MLATNRYLINLAVLRVVSLYSLSVALAAAQAPDSGSIPLGGNCTNSVQCDGSNQYATTQCYQGVCGSVGAACTSDDGSNYWFADNICLFNFCKNGRCQSDSPAELGQNCSDSYECYGPAECWTGLCGAGGAPCHSDFPFDWCQSGDCVNNRCTRVIPQKHKGESCEFDEDCVDEGVFCSPGKICGGPRAPCKANDGTAEGESSHCVSEFCKAGFCSIGLDPSPTPNNNEKRQPYHPAWSRRALCPPGITACPVQPQGYECINIRSDLESCGGCPGAASSVDCTILPDVNTVSCVNGTCAIGSCNIGFTHHPAKNACVPDA